MVIFKMEEVKYKLMSKQRRSNDQGDETIGMEKLFENMIRDSSKGRKNAIP